MRFVELELPGLILVEPDVFRDERGSFQETYHRRRYAELGLDETFVQDNISLSKRGVLRGLHFQYPGAQGKLVYTLSGQVFDVAVDVRPASPTFGKWQGLELSAESARQLWIPPGFAHGYLVLSASALVGYKCTEYHNPQAEFAVAWDDAEINIDWPAREVVLSPRDRVAPKLAELDHARLPK